MSLLTDFRQKLESKGIPPVAAELAVVLVVLIVAGAFLFNTASPQKSFKVKILSQQQLVDGAIVQVYSQAGELITQATAENGLVELNAADLPSKFTVKASKPGYLSSSGEQSAQARVDLSAQEELAVELFSSSSTGLSSSSSFNDQVLLHVLDEQTNLGVKSNVLISTAGILDSKYTNDDGDLIIGVKKGVEVKLIVKNSDYLPAQLSFLADKSEETIYLKKEGGIDSTPGLSEDASNRVSHEFVIQAYDSSGNQIQEGTITLVHPEYIEEAFIEGGQANPENVVLGQTRLVVNAPYLILSGSIRVFQNNELLFESNIVNGEALLEFPTDSPTKILVSAFDAQTSEEIQATFILSPSGDSCTEKKCALTGTLGDNTLSISAPGYKSYSTLISLTQDSPSTNVLSFPLLSISVPVVGDEEAGVSMVFLSAKNDFGQKVSQLIAGGNYSIEFFLSTKGTSKTSVSIRLGDKQSVSEEDAGIRDFYSQNAFLTKSVSYSVMPTCVDQNNNTAIDGLFKWSTQEFILQDFGGIVSFPIQVKPTAAGNSLKLFYRMQSTTKNGVLRSPEDTELGESESSEQKAGCYANAVLKEIPLIPAAPIGSPTAVPTMIPTTVPSPTTGPDGKPTTTPVPTVLPPAYAYCISSTGIVVENNACFNNLKCANTRFVFSPQDCGCPNELIQSNNACLLNACSDSTAPDACSQSNKPLYCGLKGGELDLFFDSTKLCECGVGQRISGGKCVDDPVATIKPSECVFNSQQVSVGCVLGSQPNYCNLGGLISQKPSVCGCPSGFSLVNGKCSLLPVLACELNGVKYFPGECHSVKPFRCVVESTGANFVKDPSACGCPTGFDQINGDCVKKIVAAPTPSANPTPTPSASGSCSLKNSCVGLKWCDENGNLVDWCNKCNPSCDGNDLLECSVSVCTQKTCGTTPIGACQTDSPQQCLFDASKTFFATNYGLCSDSSKGCSAGEYRPVKLNEFGQKVFDSFGILQYEEYCLSCVSENCENEYKVSCIVNGVNYAAGQLVPPATPDGFNRECMPDGTLVELDSCPDTLVKTVDGKCVKASSIVSPALPVIDLSKTCAECTKSDVLYFNPTTGQIASAGELSEYEFIFDPVFPADAMPLEFNNSNLQLGRSISLEKIVSSKGFQGCFAYDSQKKLLVSSISFSNCPVKARGNELFDSRDGRPVTTFDADFIFTVLGLIPNPTLSIKAKVTLRSQDASFITPNSFQGPGSAQLAFLVNEKQIPFGARQVKVGGKTFSLSSPQAYAIAWSGGQEISFEESGKEFAKLSYDKVFTHFALNELGSKVDSCSDYLCCSTGWCSLKTVPNALNLFKQKASEVAQMTAFRRKENGPLTTMFSSTPFEFVAPFQIGENGRGMLVYQGFAVEGTPSVCGQKTPAVYELKAKTMDGIAWEYSAKIISLEKIGELTGTCADGFASNPSLSNSAIASIPLCNFLYGDGSCIRSVSRPNQEITPQLSDEHASMKSFSFGFTPALLIPLTMCKLADAKLKSAQASVSAACSINPWASTVSGNNFPFTITNSLVGIKTELSACIETSQRGVKPVSACSSELVVPRTASEQSLITEQVASLITACSATCVEPTTAAACVASCQLAGGGAQSASLSRLFSCRIVLNNVVSAAAACEKITFPALPDNIGLKSAPSQFGLRSTAAACNPYATGCRLECNVVTPLIDVVFDSQNQLSYGYRFGVTRLCVPNPLFKAKDIIPMLKESSVNALKNKMNSKNPVCAQLSGVRFALDAANVLSEGKTPCSVASLPVKQQYYEAQKAERKACEQDSATKALGSVQGVYTAMCDPASFILDYLFG